MGRELIVYDPSTGRMIRLNVPEQTYPPPAQRPQYDPPPYCPEFQYPAVYDTSCNPVIQHRRRKTPNRQREARARRIAGMFMLFIASWIPCAFGHPGATLLIWGAGFSWLLYKWVR